MVETLLPASSFTPTGVEFAATFDTKPMMAEDLERFFRYLKELVNALEMQMSNDLAREIVLISDVEVHTGSAKAKVTVKSSGRRWTDGEKLAAATILASAINLGGAYLMNDGSPEPPLNIGSACEQIIYEAVKELDANAAKVQKSYTVDFTVKCGNTEVTAAYRPKFPSKF